jgi:hypothetical protein
LRLFRILSLFLFDMKIIQLKTYFYCTLGTTIIAVLSLYTYLKLIDVILISDKMFYVFLFPAFFPTVLLVYGIYLAQKKPKTKFLMAGIILNILIIFSQIYLFYLIAIYPLIHF